MRSTDDRWQGYDLNVEGMSLVANYRAQFNKIIRTSSYEALVEKFKLLLAESQRSLAQRLCLGCAQDVAE